MAMSRDEAKAEVESYFAGIKIVPLTSEEEVPDLMDQLVQEMVNHPAHYGGGDNPYEAIKVIEAWGLDFCLGNTVKYISRAGKKNDNNELQDLKKALWYLQRRIAQIEQGAEAGYGG